MLEAIASIIGEASFYLKWMLQTPQPSPVQIEANGFQGPKLGIACI